LVLKLSEHVRSSHNQDGAVVLDIRHGQMFRLNLVGSRMLELLKQGRSEERIVEEVSREFGVERTIVETDLREFLTHLEKNNLLELGTPETQLAL
jgi:Coenzyme PQQ synthesis protein D (PqqD)